MLSLLLKLAESRFRNSKGDCAVAAGRFLVAGTITTDRHTLLHTTHMLSLLLKLAESRFRNSKGDCAVAAGRFLVAGTITTDRHTLLHGKSRGRRGHDCGQVLQPGL